MSHNIKFTMKKTKKFGVWSFIAWPILKLEDCPKKIQKKVSSNFNYVVLRKFKENSEESFFKF